MKKVLSIILIICSCFSLFSGCTGKSSEVSPLQINSIDSFVLPEDIKDLMIKSGSLKYGYTKDYALVIASSGEMLSFTDDTVVSKIAYYGAYGLTVPLTGDCSECDVKKIKDNIYRITGIINVDKDYITENKNSIKYKDGCGFTAYVQKAEDITYYVIVIDTTDTQKNSEKIDDILIDVIGLEV